MRPPTPVPLTVARLTPASAANFRTIGVTYASSGRVAAVAEVATGALALTTSVVLEQLVG